MEQVISSLQGGMIVSCQSEGTDPFNSSPEYMALFARAAEIGGACGIRTEGIEKLMAIKKNVGIPIIGLLKSSFPDGSVMITCSYSEVESLLDAGADVIAIDGTLRTRERLSGPDFIRECKKKFGCVILADIATLDEAILCEGAGADAVSTTLNGYTPETVYSGNEPNLKLLENVIRAVSIPVFAEGRYNTPADARSAMQIGAWGVISGTAITRPRVVTRWFVDAVTQGASLYHLS